MKLLVDSCVGSDLVAFLRKAGHDVIYAADFTSDPGDNALLATAKNEQRIIITRDKDFGTLAVHQGHAHSGIIRLVRIPPAQEGTVCNSVLIHYITALTTAAIVTVTQTRVRIRQSGFSA